jgi:hypothetical protein
VQGGDPLSRKGIQEVDSEVVQKEITETMDRKGENMDREEAAIQMTMTTTMMMTMIIVIIVVHATKTMMTTIINTAGTEVSSVMPAMVMKRTMMTTTIVVLDIIMMRKTTMTLTIEEAGHVVVREAGDSLQCQEKR